LFGRVPGTDATVIASDDGDLQMRRFPRFAMSALIALACAGCDWMQFGFDAAHGGASPDQTITATQVGAGLKVAWRSTESIASHASPAVVNGVVYVTSGDEQHLDAFDAAGSTNCAGRPRRCAPLWTAVVGGATYSSPAVVDGVVYVGSDSQKLYAFDAAGNANCAGMPKTCSPLWTATVGSGIFSAPVVAGGVVYVHASRELYAFDAAGNTNCAGTPKTCAPLWTANTNTGDLSYSAPAVAAGVVYIANDPNGTTNATLQAFDATGRSGCAGVPKTCTPLWTAAEPGTVLASPVISNGVVYQAVNGGFGGRNALYAFDAGGSDAHCTGAAPNRTCVALWTAPVPDSAAATPAVANGFVYVGDGNGTLYAFDAAGNAECTGSPKQCAPVWQTNQPSSATIGFASPTVANGVVYFGRENDAIGGSTAGTGFVAYDAHGATNCDAGTPKTCAPLFRARVGNVFGSPVPANGYVYVPGAQLFAFRARGK
jgi:outer membrane protein assembly factor BamB